MVLSPSERSDQAAAATGVSGRRGALQALGALGVALLASLGVVDGASARFQTKRVVSAASAPLGTDAGAVANAFAECGGGKLLSCGYIVGGQPGELVNTIVTCAGPTDDRRQCAALLFRTAEVGASAGATIKAVALCRA